MANEFIVKKGLKVNGSVDVTGTVDGRDVATDGAKLDNIVVTQAVNLDTIESDTATNNVKVGITSAQASDITANNAKVGITPTQASNITTNNAKVSDINHNVTTNLSTSTAATTVTVVSSDGTNAVLPAATTTVAGMLTGTDKSKLNGIASGATANTGDITGVTAGTGMSGGGTSGTVTLTNSAPNVVQTTVSGSSGSCTGNATTATNGVVTTGSTMTGNLAFNAGQNITRTSHYSGFLEGSYNSVGANSTKSNPIYTIGSNYNPSDAALGNMYGIGYSHGNFNSILSGWGMYVAADGDARIGLDGSTGSIRAVGNVTAYYSDERLKDFEGTIPNALDKVKKLNGYYYKGNSVAKTFGYDTEKRQVGVSAQEVEAVMPEVVSEAAIGEGYKTVHYDKLVPLLIESIKELELRVKELENK